MGDKETKLKLLLIRVDFDNDGSEIKRSCVPSCDMGQPLRKIAKDQKITTIRK